MVSPEDLKAAIDAGELELFYQPKVSLLRGKVIGSEALVRWCRNDGTMVGPDQFIPVAESSGLLHSITLQLLGRAVSSIEKIERLYPGLTLSMNVTPHDLESHHVSQLIEGYLLQERFKPGDLQIEITESVAMADFDRVYDDLLRLNALGIGVLMDDFGTGYSSLDRLSQLPFSALKLDKGVVSRMSTSLQNLNVVRSAISMARELRMTSVAEGVESEGAYNFLLANGCEEAQGYWISQPLNFADYERFLRDDKSFHGSQIGQVHRALFNILSFRKSLIDAAYCMTINSDTVPESLIAPEVVLDPSRSRFGLWYYGVGAELDSLSSFRRLEKPFLAAHGLGRIFLSQLISSVEPSALDDTLTRIDHETAELTTGLRTLERELLRQTESDIN